ncbi:VOC family protein [Sphingomonas sp. BGYR3]|uniref:VOC family protein n=1 Tax=Sphingomonas sp. BGYR3 TaxID=2975483 RepID=UPI0021A5CA89|nr:VOC family protein [Sphingomonas sp. BGYR3]MDG5487657.1 VOC family protein [Sphingomonas sp. BGYR3]
MKVWMALPFLLASVPDMATAEDMAAPVLSEARFEQVALTVTDLDAARTFYRDRLGLRLMFEANAMLFFDVGGTRLMIASDEARQRPARPSGILYFHVEDFAAALVRLQATRATLVGGVETVQSTAAGSLRLQQFEDADGNMLAIMGFVPR